MKTLDTKEWVAVTVSIFIVGFFFVFGQVFMSLFNNQSQTSMIETPKVEIQDTQIGVGELAAPGSRVVVHYTGRFTDGTIFDSSVDRGEPFQFVLGSGQVIKGWDEGIAGMKVGGKRILTIPSSLGYGPNDYGPIPGGSTLVFEVELLKVEN